MSVSASCADPVDCDEAEVVDGVWWPCSDCGERGEFDCA